MYIYTLLKTQKNEIFTLIQDYDLEPANSIWNNATIKVSSPNQGLVRGRYRVPRLIYKNSDFYFQFELYPGGHKCLFSPGRDKPFNSEIHGSWVHLTNCIKEWLHNLKREIEAIDLWAEMEKYKTSVSLTLPEQVLNEPISVYEAERIADKLQELADKIEELFQLTKEQSQFVRSKLTYLSEVAKRQRSIDWVHTSIGVFATIAMGLALAPDQAKKLWELMKSIVGFIHLIGS